MRFVRQGERTFAQRPRLAPYGPLPHLGGLRSRPNRAILGFKLHEVIWATMHT